MYVDHLEHYGTKGMRWGHRKDGKPQGYQGGSNAVKKMGDNTIESSKKKNKLLQKFSKSRKRFAENAKSLVKSKSKGKVDKRSVSQIISDEKKSHLERLKEKTEKAKFKDTERVAKNKLKEARSKEGRKGRQIALTTHDPKVLVKYQHLLSDTELKERYNRLKLEADVRKLAPDKSKKFKEIAEGGSKVIKAVGDSPLGKAAAETGQAWAMKRLGLSAIDMAKASVDNVADNNSKKKKN